MRALRTLALALVTAVAPAAARQRLQLDVRQAEGTVKAQRAGGAGWETLSRGSLVGPGDLIETATQSRLVLGCGPQNVLVVSANTKAMVSLRAGTGRAAAPRLMGLTLFSGGALVTVARPCSAAVYTAAAVIELHEGTVAVAADPLSGETGVQALCAESVSVRNVAEARGRFLAKGQTTAVRPEAAPEAAQALTDAHVALLSSLFGDTLVRERMAACGVRPRPDESGGSEALAGARGLAEHAPRTADSRPTTYRRLFRPNDVWGGILEDRERRYRFYAPATPRGALFDNRWALALSGGAAFAGGTGYGRVALSPSVRWRFIDAALELEIARNYEKWTMPAFTDGVEGALDLVDHVTVGRPADSLFVTIGRLADYSIAEGLVVQRFTNRNPYSLFQPLALYGQAALFDMLCIDGFVADITQFTVGGLHAYLRPAGYYAGLGYYYDVNQYHKLPAGDGNRFVAALPDTVPPGRREEVHVCELNLGADIMATYAFGLRMMGELAYRFKTLTHTDGYVLRAPAIIADWKGMQLSLAYNQETGRLVSGQFNWMYPVNRYRVTDSGTALLTQNGMLSPDRVARGFALAYRYAPLPGLSFECEYRQDLLTRTVYADTTLRSRDNYEYHVAVAASDALVPFLQYARLSVGQVHGGIYPPGGSFSTGWGLHGSLAVLTRPLVANIAFEAGLEYYALDLDPAFDNRVGAADRIWEFFVGARWGFL